MGVRSLEAEVKAAKAQIAAMNIHVVGQERDGVLLIARDGLIDPHSVESARCTMIEVYDVRTRKRAVVYKHHSLFTCVGASINAKRTLLSLTTKYPKEDDGTPYPVGTEGTEGAVGSYNYESWMAEIMPQDKCYSLNVISRGFQRVQFLNDGSDEADGVSHFVFILDRYFVHYYKINVRDTQVRQRNSTYKRQFKIANQPYRQSQIATKSVWFQWDTQACLLYCLLPATPDKTSPKHIIKCYHFPNREPNLLFQAPIDIAIPEIMLREPAVYTHAACSPELPSSFLYIRAVRLRDSTFICQQLFHDPADKMEIKTIDMTIHMFSPSAQRARLNISVPVHNMPERCIRKARVFFTSLVDMLVVYIPGHYLQLLDVGPDHEPSRSLVVTGSELASITPRQLGKEVPVPVHVNPFDILPPQCAYDPLGADMNGHYLIDVEVGDAYEFALDPNAIVRVFAQETPSTRTLVHLMHLAAIHIQDPALVERIIRAACTQPGNISVDLIMEYLLGTTYQAVKDAGVPPHLLRCLPMTTIATFMEETPANRPRTTIYDCSFTSLPGTPGQAVQPSTIKRFNVRDMGTSFLSTGSAARGAPTTPHQPEDTASQVRRFFSRVIGTAQKDAGSEYTRQTPLLSDDDSDEEYAPPVQFKDALLNHLSMVHPNKKDRPANQHCVNEYRAAQVFQATRLFRCITETLGHDVPYLHDAKDARAAYQTPPESREFDRRPATSAAPPARKRTTSSRVKNADLDDSCWVGSSCTPQESILFRTMEDMYAAIEQISYPFPKGFNHQFITLGARVLSRRTFVQYIERNVLRVTPLFVRTLLSDFEAASKGEELSDEDSAFLFSVANGAWNVDECNRVLASDLGHFAYVMEQLTAKHPLQQGDKKTSADVYLEVGSSEADVFIPLGLYLNALKDLATSVYVDPQDIGFITRGLTVVPEYGHYANTRSASTRALEPPPDQLLAANAGSMFSEPEAPVPDVIPEMPPPDRLEDTPITPNLNTPMLQSDTFNSPVVSAGALPGIANLAAKEEFHTPRAMDAPASSRMVSTPSAPAAPGFPGTMGEDGGGHGARGSNDLGGSMLTPAAVSPATPADGHDDEININFFTPDPAGPPSPAARMTYGASPPAGSKYAQHATMEDRVNVVVFSESTTPAPLTPGEADETFEEVDVLALLSPSPTQSAPGGNI